MPHTIATPCMRQVETMITIDDIPGSDGDKVRVTFKMPAIEGCHCLYLVGWFEEWGESVYRMQYTDDGVWSLVLELEPGCEYVYCFRTDEGEWVYDADTPRVSLPLGSKNAFVISRDRHAIQLLEEPHVL